jgi:hypothetical protein
MKREKDKALKESPDVSRRRFLKGCGITLLSTASYQVISILSNKTDAQAGMCDAGCISTCVTSCTSCTTVNCMSGNVPPVPPPTCVQGFKK